MAPDSLLKRTAVIWRVLDEKPGHRNQVLGLTEAISQLMEVECHDIQIQDGFRGVRCLLPGSTRTFQHLPKPDLLISAGHATHIPLLRLRRAFGGKSVVLMKPTIPISAFDCCLLPSIHRLQTVPSNVVITDGVLNRVVPSGSLSEQSGLILIGGPSEHFQWSDRNVADQVRSVVHQASISWTITTSRRTPDSFITQLEPDRLNARFVPWQETPADWVPAQLATAGAVWVTCDSMSMIYEALTAGARVGLLELDAAGNTRVAQTVTHLVSTNSVTAWSRWSRTGTLSTPHRPLREAERCARELIQRFLDRHAPPIRKPEAA